MKRPWLLPGFAIGAMIIVCSGLGCGKAEEAKDMVVSYHQSTARGRVGVLRALEISDRAVALCNTLEHRGKPECGRQPDGAFQATIRIEAEVLLENQFEPIAGLEETRTVRRDDKGYTDVTITTKFHGISGRNGSQTRQERVVGDQHYVKEHNLPFVAHAAHRGAADKLLREAMDAVPAALSTGGDRWSRELEDPEGLLYTTEAKPENPETFTLTCGLNDSNKAWLRRLLEHGELSFAEAVLGRDAKGWGDRSVSTRILVPVEDYAWVVRLDVEETLEPLTPNTPIIAPTDVASVRRDRPYQDIAVILGKRLGLTDWDGAPEETPQAQEADPKGVPEK